MGAPVRLEVVMKRILAWCAVFVVVQGVAGAQVSDLDLGLALHYHLRPDIFFVPVSADRIGPPYGRAYGDYRKRGPSRDPRAFAITDREVVDLVDLRFLSEHHGVRPETVMAMRGAGRPFVVISEELSRGKDTAKVRHQRERGGREK